MRFADFGALPLTIIASLVVAVVLLVIRVMIMQRVQSRRQRENRQETERLRFLVAAYRSLAGSFTPGTAEHAMQVEETLADVVLFGTLKEVQLAVVCVNAIKRGEVPNFQPLIAEMRTDLRRQLGLDPLGSNIQLPVSGPGRTLRGGRGDGEGGGGRGEGRGGAGGGFGGGAAAGAGGGVGLGLLAGEAIDRKE